MINIINRHIRIGDNLALLPALAEYQRLHPKSVAYLECKEVREVIPSNIRLTDDLSVLEEFGSINIDIQQIHQKWHQQYHMIDSYFLALGLPVPDCPTYVPLKATVPNNLPDRYVVVAPHTVSDSTGVKRIPYQLWTPVFELLNNMGFEIRVIGGSDDEKFWEPLNDNFYFYGEPFDRVVGLIANAQAVITLDSAASHVAQAVQTVPHLLFYPAIIPLVWVPNRNPNAINFQMNPLTIDSKTMIELVKNLLDKVAKPSII